MQSKDGEIKETVDNQPKFNMKSLFASGDSSTNPNLLKERMDNLIKEKMKIYFQAEMKKQYE